MSSQGRKAFIKSVSDKLFVFNSNLKLSMWSLPPGAFSFAKAGPYLKGISCSIIIKYKS